MINYFKVSLVFAISVISIAFTFIPESLFGDLKTLECLSDNANIIVNRIIFFLAVYIIILLGYAWILWQKKTLTIKGHGYEIKIEYGDILKQENCIKVIHFDECFTTKVGNATPDIKAGSICGQYLLQYPITDAEMSLKITTAGLSPCTTKSDYNGLKKYESGRLIPNGDYFLMSFAKLDQYGRGNMTRKEYVDCLFVLWDEIDKYFANKDVCIPILGSNITRFDGGILTQQELLDVIIDSYKMNPRKIKMPCKLRIMCTKRKDFSINKIANS